MESVQMVERCIACGKTFEDGEKVRRVRKGKIESGKFVEDNKKPVWGDAHDTCFEQAVASPHLVLERIKKLARANK